MEIEIKGLENIGNKVERAKELIDELTHIMFELKGEIRPNATILGNSESENE